MNIGIVLKPQKVRDFNTLLPNLIQWLQRRKHRAVFYEQEKERLSKILKPTIIKAVDLLDHKSFFNNSELILSLGGDGTLIGVCRQLRKKDAPVLGVNMGKLGFITQFNKSEFFDALELAINKKLKPISLQLYNATVYRKNKKVFQSNFVNDAVLNRHQISRIFSLKVETKNEPIFEISGDGLIITSPIGSTAYSLAAGGPIIEPKVKALGLTPICPHGLTHRPLVIDDSEVIKVDIHFDNAPVSITLDGQESFDCIEGDSIQIKKKLGHNIKLLQNPDRTYFQTLRDKFTYGKR